MKPKKLFLTIIAAFLFSGCLPFSAPRIQPDSLTLPRGSRVLIAEAIERGFGYGIVSLRQPLFLPGLTVIPPPQNDASAISISRLIPDITAEKGIIMALILAPHIVVERGYVPYPYLKGWYKTTIRDGSVYRTIEEPQYETRYQFSCTRTTYRILQYDGHARLIGEVHVTPDDLSECPETAQVDIHFDEYDPAAAWIMKNIRIKEDKF